MMNVTEYVRNKLLALQDAEYKAFHEKLIPNVDSASVIGVRTPNLRKLATDLWKEGIAEEFMNLLPHTYYEENNLHGFFIEKIKDFDNTVEALEKFLPYVDNWATCDMMRPKAFKRNTALLFPKCMEWMHSGDTYTVRFGIGMLMSYFLDDEFRVDILNSVAEIRSDEYYINMMIAWFFATALAKQYDATLPFIEKNRLDVWVHNKTIQKAIESYRITPEQKQHLRTLKIKEPLNKSGAQIAPSDFSSEHTN